MKKVIVIGAGITGLSAAWKLSECGHKAIVIESEGQIGGLAKLFIAHSSMVKFFSSISFFFLKEFKLVFM